MNAEYDQTDNERPVLVCSHRWTQANGDADHISIVKGMVAVDGRKSV